jgi:hypothetical protein
VEGVTLEPTAPHTPWNPIPSLLSLTTVRTTTMGSRQCGPTDCGEMVDPSADAFRSDTFPIRRQRFPRRAEAWKAGLRTRAGPFSAVDTRGSPSAAAGTGGRRPGRSGERKSRVG